MVQSVGTELDIDLDLDTFCEQLQSSEHDHRYC